MVGPRHVLLSVANGGIGVVSQREPLSKHHCSAMYKRALHMMGEPPNVCHEGELELGMHMSDPRYFISFLNAI